MYCIVLKTSLYLCKIREERQMIRNKSSKLPVLKNQQNKNF